MSCDRALGKKRRMLRSFEYDNDSKAKLKNKHTSPEERIITFIIKKGDNDYDNKKIKINSSYALKIELQKLKFQIPYFIENNQERILSNDDDLFYFFHSTNYSKIYNYEFYTFFNQPIFDEQYKASQEENWTNIKKLFYNQECFCNDHLSSYSLITFKKVNFNFYNFRDTVNDHIPINIIEIFTKKEVGISTHLFLYFQNYRNTIRENERFMPFLIFKFPELKTSKKIDSVYFLLNYAIVNCFVNFTDYEKYATHLFNLIKDNGLYKINDIIFEIIKDIKNICNEKKYSYQPRVIIDRYSFKLDEKEIFKNKLYKDSEELGYKLFIIYSFKEKKTNEVLYDYLVRKKPDNYMFSYTDTLYSKIEFLPSKYPHIYSQIYPKITNYIKLQNCSNEDSAQKILKSEYNEIQKELTDFYENDDIKNFYLNQCICFIEKEIDLNKNKSLFLNIPFEIFDFREFENEKEKIYLYIKSETGFKNIETISNNSVILMLKHPLFNKLSNYIQGGIVEKAIIQIIKNGNSPFGKFKYLFKIDCFLNVFKKKDYDFTKSEIEEKIKKLKHYKRLKNKYSKIEYKGDQILIIPFNNNSKEWDLAFIIKNEKGNIELCLIQISINKTIKKIQIMLTNFINKQKYIKHKIKEIYGIQIDYTNILFILSKQMQNIETIEFMKKYNIPYIYFNHRKEPFDFRNKDNTYLNKFILSPEHHYQTNKKKFDESLTYDISDLLNYDNNDIDIYLSDEEEEDTYSSGEYIPLTDIIENEFINDEIN